MKKRVFIDMDDTMCDFSGAYKEALKREPGILYPQSQYDFFRNLEPLPGAIEGVRLLERDYEVFFLSRPSVLNLLNYTEKAVWIRDNFGQEYVDKLILCCHKGLLGELGNDILIDDNPWPDFKGEEIRFGSNNFPNWASVLSKLSIGYKSIRSVVCPERPKEDISICFKAFDENDKAIHYHNLYIDKDGVLLNDGDPMEWKELKGLTLEDFLFVGEGQREATVTFKNGDEVYFADDAFYRAFKHKLV